MLESTVVILLVGSEDLLSSVFFVRILFCPLVLAESPFLDRLMGDLDLLVGVVPIADTGRLAGVFFFLVLVAIVVAAVVVAADIVVLVVIVVVVAAAVVPG